LQLLGATWLRYFLIYQRDTLTAQMRLDAFDEPVHIAIKVRVGSDLNAVAIGERL
jgi:hypothetical protein